MAPDDTGSSGHRGNQARSGDWVRIHRILLPVGHRAPNVPADTAAKPYETWISGFALGAGALGDEIAIRTLAGREVRGVLVEVGPGHYHSFGRPHPAMLAAGPRLRQLLIDGATGGAAGGGASGPAGDSDGIGAGPVPGGAGA